MADPDLDDAIAVPDPAPVPVPVQEPDAPLDAAPVPEEVAPEPGAIVAGPGQIVVGLLDSNRLSEELVIVGSGDAGFRLVYQGLTYEQVALAPDGRRQYVPMTTR